MSIKSFIIHLERASQRKENVAQLLSVLPEAEIVSAIDGSQFSVGDQYGFVSDVPLVSPKYPFTLSLGEIGCFASHRVCWQRISDQEIPMALIVEDDVDINAEIFNVALESAKRSLGPKGYIQFQTRDVKQPTHLVAKGEAQILRPRITPLRTSAQLISVAAAQQLLSMSETIDRPVDTWLQMYWQTKVDVFCVHPSGVSDLTQETGGSSISRKRSLLQKLKAELPRAIYRRKIANLSADNWPY